jgi:glycerophosphoryl diester phosphodiesterase
VVLTAGLITAPSAQAARAADSTPCPLTLISAHEGYNYHADHDTVESQQAAYDIGANVADSDLWVTKDGYIVEMHDNDVSHSTDGTGLVTQMTLAQVLALHTKRWHDNIPQLNDSLSIPGFHEDGRYLQFETKFSFSKTANLDLLDSEINAAGMVDHVIIYSNYLKQVNYLNQIDPALTVWYKSIDGVPDITQMTGVDGVMIPGGYITKSVVATFHAANLTVSRERVGVETPGGWSKFLRTGADSLMSDDAPTVIDECRNTKQ